MEGGGGADGRVTVALSLSAGRCTMAQNGGRRSAVCVAHGDSSSGSPPGLAMTMPRECAGGTERSGETLVVRTPFLTSEGGEAGTLPYRSYIHALACHVVTTLMQGNDNSGGGGPELLTVNHGAAGSGKSIQLFGPILGNNNNNSEGGDANVKEFLCGHDSCLFSAVLEQIFAASDLDPCVALGVIECRPSSDGKNDCSFRSGTVLGHSDGENYNDGDSDSDDKTVSVEVVDLLARVTDKRSPTGCFMEDYADIPATRYVRCESVAETLEVLHSALSYSLAWQSLSTALAPGSVDVFGLPDTRSDAERRRRAAETTKEEREEQLQRQRKEQNGGGVHCTSTRGDFLRPRAGATSHVLVTLLLRYGRGMTSVWRLWDLSGPTAWIHDGTPASRMTSATHTSLSLMAHRYLHRDQLQGGWWADGFPPQQIEEIIPLFPNQWNEGGRVNKVIAMIEASLQHSCTSVLWIASLRFDACYDDINGDVLETAASLLGGRDCTNGKVIAELQRRRREENLNAAARVIDMFALSLSRCSVGKPHSVHDRNAMTLSNLQRISPSSPHVSAPAAVPVTTTPTASPHQCRLMSPAKAEDDELMAQSEIRISASVSSAATTRMDRSSNVHDASRLSLDPPPPFSWGSAPAPAPVVVDTSWSSLLGRHSCVEAQYSREGPEAPNDAQMNKQDGNDSGNEAKYPSPPLSRVSSSLSGGKMCGSGRNNLCGASPLSPPSVAGTGHPDEVVSATADNEVWEDASQGIDPDNSEISCIMEHDVATHEVGDAGDDMRGWNNGEASSPPSDARPTDLACIVWDLLEEPLSELREISKKYEEELTQHHHHCVTTELNTVVLEGLQRRVKSLVTEEEEEYGNKYKDEEGVAAVGELHDKNCTICHYHCHHANENGYDNDDDGRGNTRAACLDVFGPSVTLKTTLDRSTTVNKSTCGRSSRPHHCGCQRWARQRETARSLTGELAASERKIRFLEQQLLRLETENGKLREELSSRCVGGNAVATLRRFEGVLNDILQRCNAMYAKKDAEVNLMRRKYEAAMNSLRHLQKNHKNAEEKEEKEMKGLESMTEQMTTRMEGSRITSKKSAEEVEVMRNKLARPIFADTTNRCHAKNTDCDSNSCTSPPLSVDVFSSLPRTPDGDTSPIEHLRRVLMRATTFTTSSTVGSLQEQEEGQKPPPPPPQQHHRRHQQDTSNGCVLSIDHGSDLSFQIYESEEDVMKNGLRAFREAAEMTRNSALRALFLARQAIQKPQGHTPFHQMLPMIASNGDSRGIGSCGDNGALVTAENTLLVDVNAALDHEEVNVYQAVGLLQREAAELEHVAIEALSRERQLLSRVLLA